jgi:DNA-binding protein HU-beta
VNKKDLVDVLADATGLPDKAARKGLDALLMAIVNSVAAGEPVAIVGLGTFTSTRKAAYTGRNPSTGEPVEVPAKVVPVFKPGALFKAEVNDAAKAVAR